MQNSRLLRWLANEWENFDGLERRHVLRCECNWKLRVRNQEQEWTATALDVNPRGMRISLTTQASFKREQRIELVSHQLPVPEGLNPTAQAVVRWHRRERGALQVGVSFSNLEEVGRSWLCLLLTAVFSKQVEQRRTSLRVRCALPAEVRTPAGKYSGTLKDLSIGGALLECDEALAGAASLLLVIGPHAPLPALSISARIQRVSKPGGLFHYGLRFTIIDEARHLLLDYVRLAHAKRR